jgi:hypothetical protein
LVTWRWRWENTWVKTVYKFRIFNWALNVLVVWEFLKNINGRVAKRGERVREEKITFWRDYFWTWKVVERGIKNVKIRRHFVKPNSSRELNSKNTRKLGQETWEKFLFLFLCLLFLCLGMELPHSSTGDTWALTNLIKACHCFSNKTKYMPSFLLSLRVETNTNISPLPLCDL